MNPPALPRGRLSEVRPLARLAGPIVLSQVGSHLMVAVDTAMIGHASSVALTAAGIASVWLTGTSMLAYGVLHGMDPIVTQATAPAMTSARTWPCGVGSSLPCWSGSRSRPYGA